MQPARQRATPGAMLRVVRHTEAEMAAAARFNERMQAAGAPTDFLLPARPNSIPRPGHAEPLIAWIKFVVLDEDGEARGGFLLMTQPGWLDGNLIRVANYQSPLSEGIYDSRFGMVGAQMLRHVQREWPFAYVVGMSDPDRPLPRLLRAAAWDVRAVPWLFRMVRPGRVLRELPMLQGRRPLRVAARVGAGSGAAWLGAQALHARAWPARLRARSFTLDRVTGWGPWADDIWQRTRQEVVFAVVRDRATLQCLYPAEDGRYLIYTLRDRDRVVVYAVCVNTPMRGHAHFGNLKVATVLDAGGLPSAQPALISHVADALADDGADLLMTNQSHACVVQAFRAAGFVGGPSNYLFAASKRLSGAIGARHDRVHLTRGDGDGRIHL